MSPARVFSGKWPYQNKNKKQKSVPQPIIFGRRAIQKMKKNQKKSKKVGFGRPPLEFFRDKNVFQKMQKMCFLGLFWSHKWQNHVKTRLIGQI